MKKIFSKKYIQVVTVIILSFIIAFFAELMFNVKVLGLKGEEKGRLDLINVQQPIFKRQVKVMY